MREFVFVSAALAACSPMVYTDGVPNLDRVDDNVYRSGQITTREGWETISKLARGRHIHVLKLNFDAEGRDEPPWSVDEHLVPIQPEGDQDIVDDVRGILTVPDADALVEARSLICDPPPGDFWLVHCTHGQDRTGLVVAEYRVLCDGWTLADARAEMLAHHYHTELVGLETAWHRFSVGLR